MFALALLLTAGNLFQSSMATLPKTRCPRITHPVCVPLVTKEDKSVYTAGDIVAAINAEGTREVHQDLFAYLDTTTQDRVATLEILAFGDSEPDEFPKSLKKYGDGDETVGVFIVTAEGITSLVDCIKVVQSDFFVYDWYGRRCRGKVNEKVKETCTSAYTSQNASIIGSDGTAVYDGYSVSDPDEAYSNILITAEGKHQLIVDVQNIAEFNKDTSVTNKQPGKPATGGSSSQGSKATNQVAIRADGDDNTVDLESTAGASEDRATSGVSVAVSSTSNSTKTTRKPRRRPRKGL